MAQAVMDPEKVRRFADELQRFNSDLDNRMLLLHARFAVLRDAEMPAVMIEGGFMSHPSEGRKIFDASYRREMAKAIVNGLLSYKRQVEQGS